MAVFATEASTARMKSQLISSPSVARVLQAEFSFTLDLRGVARRARAGNAGEPSNRRVVIVSPGVDHDVLVIVVRQIDVLRIAAETKLQDAHAGQTEIVAQAIRRPA